MPSDKFLGFNAEKSVDYAENKLDYAEIQQLTKLIIKPFELMYHTTGKWKALRTLTHSLSSLKECCYAYHFCNFIAEYPPIYMLLIEE